MSHAPPRRRAHTSQRATGRFGVFSTIAAVMLALLLPSAAGAADPPASAGWHGRAIQDAARGAEVVATPASFPAGWSAGAVKPGTGFRHAGGSVRVREVQKRLWNLGFRPGPVDGLFGPRTRAAVQWFQIKHSLAPDGVVGLRTLTLLRERTAEVGAPAVIPEAVRGEPPATPPVAPVQPAPATQPADGSRKAIGGHGATLAPMALLALALLLLGAPAALTLTSLRRGWRGNRKPRRPGAQRKPATGPAPQPASPERSAAVPLGASPERATAVPLAANPGASAAIGYVRSARRDRAELARHAGAVRRACTSRGWRLAELVCDDQAGEDRTFERPGLAAAMERLSGPGRSRLVVSKLEHLSRSAPELTALFEWFARHEVEVIAADAGTATPQHRGRTRARTNSRNGVAEKAQVG